jgi:hypothetical protein
MGVGIFLIIPLFALRRINAFFVEDIELKGSSLVEQEIIKIK